MLITYAETTVITSDRALMQIGSQEKTHPNLNPYFEYEWMMSFLFLVSL